MIMLLVIIATVTIFIIDGVPLCKKKQWKELIVLVVLIIIAFSILISKNVGLPSPIHLVNNLFIKYGEKLFGSTM